MGNPMNTQSLPLVLFMDKLKQFLRQIVPISDEEFGKAIPYFEIKNLKKGEYFVHQNKICRQIAFINKGSLKTYYINHKSDEVTSCFCGEHCFVTSYKSFIKQVPSELAIQAMEDVELLVISREGLYKLYDISSIWQTIGRILAENEYLVMEKYASVLNNESAKEKYLRLMEEQPDILQKASVEDIASYLGVTRRTLSRIRKEISNM
jgi:CRP-like cAMP-binding protein